MTNAHSFIDPFTHIKLGDTWATLSYHYTPHPHHLSEQTLRLQMDCHVTAGDCEL